MSRQQKRASIRKVAKAITHKPVASAPITNLMVGGTVSMPFASLNERQKRGVELWMRAQVQNGTVLLASPELVVWFSQNDKTSAYHVERRLRNYRSKMVVEYTCTCPDFGKHGRTDCKHIFAEKLRREEILVTAVPRKKPGPVKQAKRRPARVRFATDGTPIKRAQRNARREMPIRIPILVSSLKSGFDQLPSGIIIPTRKSVYKGGKKPAPASSRATALVSKVAYGVSASQMIARFEELIAEGLLRLRRAPSENTFTQWMNDERLTPVLHEFLRLSSVPFREQEIGAIIDSSKVSQLMTAHAKEVEYNNHDKRPGADWMKCHALVGVESLIVMAVEFSGSAGSGTHDAKFMEPLVEKGLQTFPLQFLLADKAYLSGEAPAWLADRGIKAVIPIKKNWFKDGSGDYNLPLMDLVEWYDRNENRDFHEVYRLRSKIEGLFSLLKRMAGGFCWSRGRKHKIDNRHDPCTAWKNEVLCKLIYLNLRTTVTMEEETGVLIDYRAPSRRFLPPDQPLLLKRAA